jgi:hypothetical protein
MARLNLDGCWAKWEQGHRHLNTLHNELGELIAPLEGGPIPFEPQLEARTPLDETWLFTLPEVPDLDDPRFALIVGDVLGCFRGAIDHLAWAAVKHIGTPLNQLSRRTRKGIAFPLAASWKSYAQAFDRGLPGIQRSSSFGQLTKQYQACGRNLHAPLMRALRNLGDRDKHRLLIPTFWFPEGAKFKIIPKQVAVRRVEWLVNASARVPFHSHKPIVRVTFSPLAVFQQPQLELQAEATFHPALGGSLWMVPALHGIGGTVASLLYEATPILFRDRHRSVPPRKG